MKKSNSLTTKKIIKYSYIALLYYFSRLLIYCIPLKFYYRKIFVFNGQENINLQPYLKDIRQIYTVLDALPGKKSCLIECFVIHFFFLRKGIVIPIFLGVKTSGPFQAHAWFDSKMSNGFHKLEN